MEVIITLYLGSATIVHGQLQHKLNYYLFCQKNLIKKKSIVKNSENLDYRNLESNLGLLQTSTLVLNILITTTNEGAFTLDVKNSRIKSSNTKLS